LLDEATLLVRIRQCDSTALAQVYDDYYERIYRYVYGYLGRATAAEDLAANVFFRLLRATREGKSPDRNLVAWLYRVAHNLVVDTFRRMPPEELELAEWVESKEPDPADIAEQHLLLERVRVALRELTESQQQVIVLKFFDGMDNREIADIVGKSEGAIDALQHRALCTLRKVLREPQGPPSRGPAADGRTFNTTDQDTERDSSAEMISRQTMQLIRALLRSLARVWMRLTPVSSRWQTAHGRPDLSAQVTGCQRV
jgi:RNA polymerase sigma-70 factor (ECF subfamily)